MIITILESRHHCSQLSQLIIKSEMHILISQASFFLAHDMYMP
ncbi:unnamed protein product [Paramecium pentaurelia]|uniref:Uncharacterized protein n=1 Tax=Paramecium pentaurelia TaxID=43138 RepID=A0A8S1WEN3_9CILI|nr:unnamed protein product [Paramecium pentaurelia]